ncbi:MAG: hypothetical protein QW728_06895 [Thermoplasmata archaeon]
MSGNPFPSGIPVAAYYRDVVVSTALTDFYGEFVLYGLPENAVIDTANLMLEFLDGNIKHRYNLSALSYHVSMQNLTGECVRYSIENLTVVIDSTSSNKARVTFYITKATGPEIQRPIPSALVRLYDTNGFLKGCGVTGALGESLMLLSKGDYHIYIEADGYERYASAIKIEIPLYSSGGTPLFFRFNLTTISSNGTIYGVVKAASEDGENISKVEVDVYRYGEKSSFATSYTDVYGNFRISLAAGLYNLSFRKEEFNELWIKRISIGAGTILDLGILVMEFSFIGSRWFFLMVFICSVVIGAISLYVIYKIQTAPPPPLRCPECGRKLKGFEKTCPLCLLSLVSSENR